MLPHVLFPESLHSGNQYAALIYEYVHAVKRSARWSLAAVVILRFYDGNQVGSGRIGRRA
jgi:hypothetical protein